MLTAGWKSLNDANICQHSTIQIYGVHKAWSAMPTAGLQDDRLLHIYINFQQGKYMEVRAQNGSSTPINSNTVLNRWGFGWNTCLLFSVFLPQAVIRFQNSIPSIQSGFRSSWQKSDLDLWNQINCAHLLQRKLIWPTENSIRPNLRLRFA